MLTLGIATQSEQVLIMKDVVRVRTHTHRIYVCLPQLTGIFFFSVGKTSLITRFMYDSFDNTYQVREILHNI
jgi:hypothetical protein